jgi:hypothetical protein
MAKETGWKPIPLSLKIVSVFLILWILGSLLAISGRYQEGLPLLGVWVSGLLAATIVFLLDIVGPVTFLYALWNRKSWGLPIAYGYLGIFVINHIVALFIFKEQLGLMPILIPSLVNLVFLIVIYKKRDYLM